MYFERGNVAITIKREPRAVLHDTSLPIVIEDVLGLATQMRASKGIIVKSFRSLMRQAIPLPDVERWATSFLCSSETRLDSVRFHLWDFIEADNNAVTAILPYMEETTVIGWNIVGINESLDSLRNEFFVVCNPMPSIDSSSSSSVIDGAIQDSIEESAASGHTLSDDSIRKLSYRAGIPALSMESMNVIRGILTSFISSILSESMASSDASSTRPEQGLVLSRDLDNALDPVGFCVAGLGYRGLWDIFTGPLASINNHIRSTISLDLQSIRVMNDYAV